MPRVEAIKVGGYTDVDADALQVPIFKEGISQGRRRSIQGEPVLERRLVVARRAATMWHARVPSFSVLPIHVCYGFDCEGLSNFLPQPGLFVGLLQPRNDICQCHLRRRLPRHSGFVFPGMPHGNLGLGKSGNQKVQKSWILPPWD